MSKQLYVRFTFSHFRQRIIDFVKLQGELGPARAAECSLLVRTVFQYAHLVFFDDNETLLV